MAIGKWTEQFHLIPKLDVNPTWGQVYAFYSDGIDFEECCENANWHALKWLTRRYDSVEQLTLKMVNVHGNVPTHVLYYGRWTDGSEMSYWRAIGTEENAHEQ